MRVYRVVRATVRGYPIVVFVIYVAALVLALSLMFIFPPATILLLWMALVGLVFVVIGAKLLDLCRRVVARVSLGRGVCPACGEQMAVMLDDDTTRRCAGCAAVFDARGAEIGPADANLVEA